MTPAYGLAYSFSHIPTELDAGVTYGGIVELTNTGTTTWPAPPADGHPVDTCVFLDDVLYAVLPLPNGDVGPGATVTLPFAFRVAEPGTHVLRIEAVHEHVTWFSTQHVAPLVISLTVHPTPPTTSTTAMRRTLAHNLWHYLPTSGIQSSRDGRPFPLFISRAKGCHVWDPEGHQFLDYTMGWGTTVLGYADDRVQTAMRPYLETAPLPSMPDPVEMEVSERLVRGLPSAEMVTFGKNGSDMCTLAARLSRLITGKRTILSSGFHGWQDFALDYFPFEVSGIPERPNRTLWKIRFNDRADFLAHFARCRDDLAAVMIEPSGPYLSDEEGFAGDIDRDWLDLVVESARSVGALVIFDEIITGFRYPQNSVQASTGVRPDFTCLGKALASGMPLAALLGSAAHFHQAFRSTHYASTFKGEVYSFAAAKAAIDIYQTTPVADAIWRYGSRLQAGIDQLCRDTGVPAACQGPPFRFALHFSPSTAYQRRVMRTIYTQELLKSGILTVTGAMLPSTAHDEHTFARTLSAVGGALERIAHGTRRGTLERDMEIPLL